MIEPDPVVDAAAWAIHQTAWGTGGSLDTLPEETREARRAEARAALKAAVAVSRERHDAAREVSNPLTAEQALDALAVAARRAARAVSAGRMGC